jgi:hypothetical protein
MEERFQDFAHGSPPCCHYNIEVLPLQHRGVAVAT